MLEDPVTNGVERLVEQGIGHGIEVEVAGVDGSVLGGIRLEGLSTTRPASGGLIRAVTVDRFVVSYRLRDVLAMLSAVGVPLLRDLRGIRETRTARNLSWIGEPSLPAVVANLHESVPTSLRMTFSGRIDGADEVMPGFEIAFDLDGSVPAKTELFALALDGIASPWNPVPEVDRLHLTATARAHGIFLASSRERSAPDARLDAGIQTAAGASGPVLSTAELDLVLGRLTARALVGPRRADISVSLPPRQRVREIFARAAAEPAVTPGAISLDASAVAPADDEERSVATDSGDDGTHPGELPLLHALIDDPVAVARRARITGAIDAKGWTLRSVGLDELVASATWTPGTLEVRGLRAAVGVEGLAFAGDPTAAEPATDLSVDLARARWQIDEKRAEVENLVVSSGSGELRVDGGIAIPERGGFLEQARGSIAGSLTVDEPERLSDALARSGLIPALPVGYSPGTRLRLEFDVRGGREDPRIETDVAVERPAVAGVELDAFTASLSSRANTITVSSLVVERGDSRIEARGTVVRRGLRLEAYTAELFSTRVGTPAAFVDGFSVVASGTPGSVRVEKLEATFTDPEGLAISLARPFAVSWTDDRLRVDELAVTAGSGSLAAAGSLSDEEISVDVHAEGVALSLLLDAFDPESALISAGTLDLEASVRGPIDRPDFRLALSGDARSLEGEPIVFDVRVVQENDTLRVESMNLDVADLPTVRGSGTLPVLVGSSGVRMTSTTGEGFTLEAGVTRPFERVGVDPGSSLAGADLTVEAGLDGGRGVARAVLSGIERRDEPALEGIDPVTEIVLDLTLDELTESGGELSAVLRANADTLVDAFASFDLEEEQVSARADVRVPLARITHLIPDVSLLGGEIRGSVSLTGSPDELTPDGELRVVDGLAKLAPTLPAVSGLTGSVSFDARTIVVSDLSGLMGKAPVVVNGEAGLPEDSTPYARLSIFGENALLARTPDLRARADLDLELNSDAGESRVRGAVTVTDVRYTRPVQLFSLGTRAASPTEGVELFAIDAAWARSVALDVRLLADQTITIANNLYEGPLSADLRVRGTAAVPRAEGRLFTASGTITLPTASLEVEDMEVVFPADASFDPSLRLSARTRVQGYRMSVSAEGQIPNVEIRIVSSPPLPTDEALVLLTTGRRASELEFTADVSQTLTAVGTVIGRSFLNRLAESTSEDARGFLDRLEFEIERSQASGLLGDIDVEYQLADGARWHLLFERGEEDDYSVQLAWRVWVD